MGFKIWFKLITTEIKSASYVKYLLCALISDFLKYFYTRLIVQRYD